ncbi:MAG TPA: diaminopimelate epimerase [Deltaproteobacteria bacterium]|nr:diaminopimelate epimerase [Deltaproteobacteria bacterium]
MGTIHFTKMAGAGNDFVMVNACSPAVRLDWNRLASIWCRPKTGIGADGLVVLEPDVSADFAMRIFNADGTEAEMCGNGARCAALFAMRQGLAGPVMRFRTGAGFIGARVDGTDAAIEMTDPCGLETGVDLEVAGDTLTVHVVNTGVPHAVVFTRRVDDEPVDRLGPLVRNHERFRPAGTNVDFVEIVSPDTLKARTYERGVEAETLACGTGAVASAVVAHRMGVVDATSVKVMMRGGDLMVSFATSPRGYCGVMLMGPVDEVFRGEIEVPS